MFYYLKGIITELGMNLAVLDCNGVGFAVNTSANTIARLHTNDQATLYTYCSIREDAFDIYGFSTKFELDAFKLLISVTGVGPKAAVSILSAVTTDQLNMAILTQNEKMLTSAQGIGKKIAQRIILELKDKIGSVAEASYNSVDSSVISPVVTSDNKATEAIQALQALGYDYDFITKSLKGLDTTELSTQDIIKAVLKKAIK